VLAIVQHHALAERGVELGEDALVPNAEVPDDRRDARDDGDRELSLVGLAEPALARELLEDAGPLALEYGQDSIAQM
jgi:hypothetical protein